MRVGVVLSPSDPAIGGRYSFQNSVLEGLLTVVSHHEIFLLITNGILPHIENKSVVQLVDLQGRYGRIPPRQTPRGLFVSRFLHWAGSGGNEKQPEPTLVQRAVEELQLEVVWFADPEGEKLAIPYFATVWDLEHRKQPFFPEVNSSGWGWESRERHYGGFLPRAARIFTGTETGKREIVRYYGINPANVVVNPLVVPKAMPILSAEKDADVLARYALPRDFLLYPAQFWPHKNHVNLLHALKILQIDHGLSPALVLTGSDKGNLHHVRAVIAELGLEDRVHCLGFVPTADLETLYRHAAAMVFPTLFGPDNIPPLEAFLLGCPVVASDIPGAREQLGEAALFFDPVSPDDMASQLAKLLTSPELKASLVESGRNKVATLTPQGYVQVFYRVLDEFAPLRANWRNDYLHT